jgi:glycosyltransferase involved in cell wall biosynthesis
LVPGKRPLMAVDVIAELVRRGVDVHMTWVGGGPLEATVRNRIDELGLDERFILTGMVSPSDVFDYFDDANLFFVPTARENFFTAAAEAVSAGRPVVAARVGGFTDYLDSSNAEYAVDSVNGYADAILAAQQRFDRVPEARIADPIRARFALQTVGGEFEALYRRVAADLGR